MPATALGGALALLAEAPKGRASACASGSASAFGFALALSDSDSAGSRPALPARLAPRTVAFTFAFAFGGAAVEVPRTLGGRVGGGRASGGEGQERPEEAGSIHGGEYRASAGASLT